MSEVAEAPPVAFAETRGGVVAYLSLDGAMKAAKFYEQAFGATIATMHPLDEQGRTMHIHMYLNGSSLMLGDGYPEQGHPALPAQGFNLMLPVADIQAAYRRAVEAGCTAVMAPQTMFWGDTFGQLKDPFGVDWTMNQPA